MEEGGRNGGGGGGVIKNRNSTGCLIIKKKADDIVYTRKEKRLRLADSDSESLSDDELLDLYRQRAVSSNQVSTSVSGRVKRNKKNKEVDFEFGREELFPEARKRSAFDVYDFDEYDDLYEMEKVFGGSRREVESGARRWGVAMSDRKRSFGGSSGGASSAFDEVFGTKSKVPVKERVEGGVNEAIRLQGKNGVLKVMVKNNVGGGSSMGKKFAEVEGSRASRSREVTPKNSMPRRGVYAEKKVVSDPNTVDRIPVGKMRPRKLLPAKGGEDSDEESEEMEEPARIVSSSVKTPRPTKRGVSKAQVTPSPDSVQASKSKDSKAKRGSGTEKQLLREKIRSMLVGAGWTIDYRPRKNRDYFDAVYINPAGTAYWSIIKAYDALKKQIEEKGAEADGEKPVVDEITGDVLSKLTRQTQKKLEKERKRKNREEKESKRKKKAASGKFVNDDPETDCTDSGSEEDKLSTFMKQTGISKGRLHELRNGSARNQTGKVQERIEKTSAASSHAIHGRKTKKIGRCTLLVRNADKELNSEGDSFVPYKGKRTILSWLIDSGTVKLSEKVLYMNRRRTRVMLEGWMTRDGIHCGCCSKILTVSKFEIHAASKLRQPYQNICLPSGVSLLQCQVDAWNSQDHSQRTGFNTVDVDGDDQNDDTCGICGDGGNLICCDGCPSTFHQSCVGVEMLPSGDWHCPHCSCKFCGLADVDTSQNDENASNELAECNQCEKKYHKKCIPEKNSITNNSSNQISFCGRKCHELFEQLQKLLGVKHDLESGLSWSLIHRNDLDADPSHRGFSQKVEWNAKLAVALTIMDECFLPITDRRSGIKMIQSVFYNCRSNFNRLNYGGFYTAILERGDEIISAASIRIHGNQLAEMPFIGTRHIYRRQGMCRRLLFAIESALRSLKVEKLIIPAISDMMNTWTNVFGFSALTDSHKQDMKSLNMLVFPGTDMLQKKLVKQVTSKRDVAACKDICKEDDGGSSPLPDLTKGSDMETSASEASAGDPLPHNDLSTEKSDALQHDHIAEKSDALQNDHIAEESDALQNDDIAEKSDAGLSLQNSGISLNIDSLPALGLDGPRDIQEPRKGKVSQKTEISSELVDKIVKYPSDNVKVEVPSEARAHNLHASTEGVESDRHENKAASADSGSEAVDGSVVGIPDSASDAKKPSSLDASHETLLMGKPVLDSSTENIVQAVEVDCNAPSEVDDKSAEVTSSSSALKKPSSLDASHDILLMGIPVLDSSTENIVHAVEVDSNAPSEVDDKKAEVDSSTSAVKKPPSLDASHETLFMGKPVLATENIAQAVEVDINTPSETEDKNAEVDTASKPVATSPSEVAEVDSASKPVATSLTMIHPRADDSNQSDLLIRSVEPDSAAGDSIQPHIKTKLDASLVINAKTQSDFTLGPSGASTLTTLACSDGTDEHTLQTKEDNPDSSLDNIQLHPEGEKYAASEAKDADTNHLLEASVVSSNGTFKTVPCSDRTDAPVPRVLVQAAEHSQTEQHFGMPAADTKLGSLSGASADNEFHGMQSHKSGSTIEGMTSDPIENGLDSTHENNIEVAGILPGL